ncbi:MAG: nifS [Clostridia bacterium]|nr:nifS [Clostridia bacterium]
MNNRFVYLDHAATTAMRPEVYEAMQSYFIERYGNPSSIYSFARDGKKAIEGARDKVAGALGARAEEIFFTGSGTEADNWAIKGVAYANKFKGNHIITTSIEHHAVLNTCQYLEGDGFEVTYLPVDENGLVTPEQVERAIKSNTILISIMFANNEIGTIQPIAEIGKLTRKRGIYFHTDAVQAVGNVPINVAEMNIDLLSLSGHKFYGPKGIGSLYIRKGVKITSFLHGGAQERGRRASTENVPAIVGLGKAIEMASSNIEEESRKLIALRDRTIDEVMKGIPFVKLNGHRSQRLPGNINFSFEFIEGESVLLMLDMKGIAASTGSACTSGSLDPSHILLAIGVLPELANGSLRLTFGEENTQEDVDYLLEVLPAIVERLREMSPLYEGVEIGGKSYAV